MNWILPLLLLASPVMAQLPNQQGDEPIMENLEFLFEELRKLESDTNLETDKEFKGDVTIEGTLEVSGKLTVSNGVYIAGDLNLSGKLNLGCPTLFTEISTGDEVLGCIQTDLVDTNDNTSWQTAVDYCFDTYGGTIPDRAEYWAALTNYALTNETGNWTWISECNAITSCLLLGNPNIDSTTADGWTTASYNVRCWIPR